ncbi:MAG: hypothetical protein ACR2OV_00130 [Hyphomicrobiaceae bacterium]
MRYLTLALLGLTMACAPITAQLDAATGTTLEERCGTRRAAVAAWDAMEAAGGELSGEQSSARIGYQIYIDAVCPALPLPE